MFLHKNTFSILCQVLSIISDFSYRYVYVPYSYYMHVIIALNFLVMWLKVMDNLRICIVGDYLFRIIIKIYIYIGNHSNFMVNIQL